VSKAGGCVGVPARGGELQKKRGGRRFSILEHIRDHWIAVSRGVL